MGRRKIKNRAALIEEHVRLHAEGLSLREIAARTGVHYTTVRDDLARWHEQLLRSLTDPWPRAERLAWLVAHPDDENYPWNVLDSGAPQRPGIQHNPTAEQTDVTS